MRWSVKVLLLLALSLIVALLVTKLALPKANDRGSLPFRSSHTVSNSDPSERANEFPRKVYAANRERADEATPPEDETELAADHNVALARQLLALAPSLPDDEQMAAARRAANLIEDGDYDVLREALLNAVTPEPMLDELLTDLLNRDDALALPVLVDLARQPNHPRAGEARHLLELHLDHDYGANWSAWLHAVRRRLAQDGE